MLNARLSRTLAAGILLAGTQLALAASPAHAAEAGPHFTFVPSFLASTDASTPDTTEFFPGGYLGVGSSRDQDGRSHTSRVHLGFDVTQVRRARLSKAELLVLEADVTDCAKHRAIKAQATTPFIVGNTWRNPPVEVGGQVTLKQRAERAAMWTQMSVVLGNRSKRRDASR